MEFSKVAIVTRYGSKVARDIANIVAKMLTSYAELYTVKPLMLDNSRALDKESMLIDEGIELLIAIGGDGTTLRAIRWIDGHAPVFSIRIKGSRGVLADVDTDSIHEAIDMINSNNYYIDEKDRIYAIMDDKASYPAVNDITIAKVNHNITPRFRISIDKYNTSQKMDGLVISTAIGSSAYCYSLGGPIMHEDSKDLALIPIASIDRFPIIIIPIDHRISIKADDRCIILADGQASLHADEDTLITIRKHERSAKFLRLKRRGLSHLERLGY